MLLEPDKVTIDKIQLVKNISSYNFKSLSKNYIDIWQNDPQVQYYESLVWNKNRHNWKYTGLDKDLKEFTIYVGYQSNIPAIKNRFTLEYNPNKVDPDNNFLHVMLNLMKYSKGDMQVQKFDVAFDYEGLRTTDIVFNPEGKKAYSIHQFPNGSDLTYYIGKGNGQIKIYDKAHEETEGQADYQKVRYEATISAKWDAEHIDLYNCTTSLPEQLLNDIQGLYDKQDGLSPTDKLIMYSVQNGFPLKELTYEQRKKYKKNLKERKFIYTKIAPSQVETEKALKEYIHSLNFINIISQTN